MMSDVPQQAAAHLVQRTPSISGVDMVSSLVPPPQFEDASFASYRPDPEHPSQEEARALLQRFVNPPPPPQKTGFFSFGKKKPQATNQPVPMSKPGVYLDGGFGVGKTHLLAASWHAAYGRKYFGTFIEYTSLVGALGYSKTVETLRGAQLICIDEFELDDPGDTMIMTRLIGELTSSGTKFLATSNTPPNALGEGRFAAQDFLREIQAMSDRFHTVRIDGNDYRQRDLEGDAVTLSDDAYRFMLADGVNSGDRVTDDTFTDLIDHLATVHPVTYARLVDGVNVIGIRDVHELTDQTKALRLVAFIDRVYDAQIPIRATGIPFTQVFGGGMLDGGYRKKYLRCMSRLNALTSGEL